MKLVKPETSETGFLRHHQSLILFKHCGSYYHLLFRVVFIFSLSLVLLRINYNLLNEKKVTPAIFMAINTFIINKESVSCVKG